MDQEHYSQIFHAQVEKYGERTALCFRKDGEWHPVSWREFGEQADALSAALITCGIAEQESVGIFSGNCPEWTIADMGSMSIRAVTVPVHATSTVRQTEYIVRDAGIRVMFVGDQSQYDKVAGLFSSTSLEKVVVFDRSVQFADGTDSVFFDDFLETGRNADSAANEIAARAGRFSREDLATIIYTSGTTGEPKGVMLTHANILFQSAAHDQRLMKTGEEDVSLCFLPLSHVFERIWTWYVFYRGMTNYYLDDPKQVITAIREVRPTIMCAVPRFYEKIYAAVHNRLESGSIFRKKLFRWAVQAGMMHHIYIKDEIRSLEPLLCRIQYRIADALVLKKIRALTGGRVRFFPFAVAPLSPQIEQFFYAAGMFVTYGYGLTETSATATCHEPHYFKFGAVGKPLPGVKIKIDPDTSEILVRGGNVMKGYYNKPEATAEVFTSDGFFRTGDAGKFEPNGELLITERIKELIKTSGGKYVAPQLLESTIGADHYIEQIVVIGEGRKFISALLVPSFEALEAWAGEKKLEFGSRAELIEDEQVRIFYEQRIADLSKNFADYEKIKKFRLLETQFTVEEGEITPTLKVRRKIIEKKYQAIIESFYRE